MIKTWSSQSNLTKSSHLYGGEAGSEARSERNNKKKTIEFSVAKRN